MAPRVAEAVELRLADARVVVDRDLADPQLAAECLEDHLRRELHPSEWRSSVASASRRTARIPQCASETLTPKRRFSRPVRIGLPIRRLSHGIASPWILPLKREPITRSSPCSRRSTNGASSLDRVRLVGVAHHDVRPRAHRRAPRGTRCRSRAAARGPRSRRARRPPRAERSVDALSTTITSPVRPERRMPSQAWSTTAPTASSSLRQGMTTEISGRAIRPLSATMGTREAPISGAGASAADEPRECEAPECPGRLRRDLRRAGLSSGCEALCLPRADWPDHPPEDPRGRRGGSRPGKRHGASASGRGELRADVLIADHAADG